MAKPPKIQLPYAPPQLRLVDSNSPAADSLPAEDHRPLLYRGVALKLHEQSALNSASDLNLLEGFVGGCRWTVSKGVYPPVAADANTVYYWSDAPLAGIRLRDNDCQLMDSSLDELSLEPLIDASCLSITPRFNIRYTTRSHAARLGEIRLVDAHRFITDENGTVHTLLDTREQPAVLYQEDPQEQMIVRQRTPWQLPTTECTYTFNERVIQLLQPLVLGVPVKSVTVLEQYTSYFMEQPLLADTGTLWVPAMAPVIWGWSIRVEPDGDDWMITRRKLVPPIVGSDGLALPEWQGSCHDFRHSVAGWTCAK